MDNLTHSLTGVLLSRAGLNRVHPKASWLLFIALNSPDIDLVLLPASAHVYLDHHRGWTHSVFLAPLVAFVPMVLMRQFGWRAWLLGLAGALAHIFQDSWNVYGVRALRPFTDQWYRFDIVSVVDPWVWTLLFTGFLWPHLSRLVSSEIGTRSKAAFGAGLARTALALLLAYAGARFALHARAIETLHSRIYAEGAIVRAAAFPTPANPLAWRGALEFGNAWRMLPVPLDEEFNPAAGAVYYKGPPNPAARASEPFQAFLRFSQFPVWRSTPDPAGGGTLVEATDLRFGVPGEQVFSAIARLDSEGRLVDARYQFEPPGVAPRLR